MPPKREDRIQALEHSVKVLMEIIATRDVRYKDSDTQTVVQHTIAAGTQTANRTSSTISTQSEFRKNVTERGNQIKPHVKEACTNTECKQNDALEDAHTQTEKVISIADIFLKKVSQQILPELNNIDNNWIVDETKNNTFRTQNVLECFHRIKNRQFNTSDVVEAMHACIRMIIVTYSQGMESYVCNLCAETVEEVQRTNEPIDVM